MGPTQEPPRQRPAILGYPAIEALLDTEDFAAVEASFTSCYETLERLLKDASGVKKSGQIHKILKTYELTVDLLKHLIKTKYEMAARLKGRSPGGQNPGGQSPGGQSPGGQSPGGQRSVPGQK